MPPNSKVSVVALAIPAYKPKEAKADPGNMSKEEPPRKLEELGVVVMHKISTNSSTRSSIRYVLP